MEGSTGKDTCWWGGPSDQSSGGVYRMTAEKRGGVGRGVS